MHASGGRRTIEAAREALDTQSARPLLIAVTVLTSMDASDLAEHPSGPRRASVAAGGAGAIQRRRWRGVLGARSAAVARRARPGVQAGHPGIRLADSPPTTSAGDDPSAAIAAGSGPSGDYGWPITRADELFCRAATH